MPAFFLLSDFLRIELKKNYIWPQEHTIGTFTTNSHINGLEVLCSYKLTYDVWARTSVLRLSFVPYRVQEKSVHMWVARFSNEDG